MFTNSENGENIGQNSHKCFPEKWLTENQYTTKNYLGNNESETVICNNISKADKMIKKIYNCKPFIMTSE